MSSINSRKARCPACLCRVCCGLVRIAFRVVRCGSCGGHTCGAK